MSKSLKKLIFDIKCKSTRLGRIKKDNWGLEILLIQRLSKVNSFENIYLNLQKATTIQPILKDATLESTAMETTETIQHHFVPLVSAGSNHSLVAISGHSSVYVCGDNKNGQLGIKQNDNLLTFKEYKLPFIVGNFIICGWDTSFIIDDNGTTWACGDNRNGLLGVGQDLSTREWSKISQLEECVKVACGLQHTLFLLKDGSVFGCGKLGRSLGKLFPTNDKLDWKPIRAKVNNVVDIACGMYHCILLTRKGQVLVFGKEKFNLLGSPAPTPAPAENEGEIHLSPSVMDSNDHVTRLFSSWSTGFLSTRRGNLFAWGRCDLGQFNPLPDTVDSNQKSTSTLTRINLGLNEIIQFSAGSEFAIAQLSNRKLAVWGYNEHGNLGMGHVENVFDPVILDGIPNQVIAFSAGYGHSLIITDK